MKYNFMITEYLRRSVRIEAEDEEEAYQKIEDLLSTDAICLGDKDFSNRDIETINDYENDETYPVDEDFSEPKKVFEHREYAGITFPVRECTWERFGKTACRYVASDIMKEAIFNNNGLFKDNEARQLDCGIAYYIPHDTLMTASDDDILDYIFNNIEEAVMDIFEE